MSGGGVGRAEPISFSIWPFRPSGVQAHTAIAPPGRVDAHHLVGRRLVARGEDAAKGRHHDVERVVGERQIRGVALDPLDLDPGLGGAAAARLEELRGDVGGGDPRPALGRPDRDVAVAGAYVEHVLTAMHVHALHELIGHGLDRGGNARPVT